MKVFWIIIGILVVIIGGVVVGGFVWWNNNQESIMQQLDEAQQDAERVAQTGDSNQCVTELKKRIAECDGLVCSVSEQMFLTQCLNLAPYAAGFCNDVPNRDQWTEQNAWLISQCADTGKDVQQCMLSMGLVVEYCESHADSPINEVSRK